MTAAPATAAEHVLVIKLGALGDFVQALGPFAAIRHHHRDALITLLTTEPYVRLGRMSGLFDHVWAGGRPGALEPGAWWRLCRCLRGGAIGRVYDLQTAVRSSFYRRLFWPGPYPEWSGTARGCSHPHANPERDFMHTIERQKEQLALAGIEPVPDPDLSWVDADASRFGIEAPYVLLVPAGAAHRPEKRWPAERFAELALRLARAGIAPVVLGGEKDAGVAATVCRTALSARNLAGETELEDVVALARAAAAAAGNDTGPMHLTAVAGCRSVVLYSRASDPVLCAQRGPDVRILRRERLDALSVDDVWAALGLP